jgi:hypothetical protein
MAARLKLGAYLVGVALRLVVCGLGAVAVVWALYTLPIFWYQFGVEQMAKRIVAGDAFKPAVLSFLDTTLISLKDEKWHRPSVLSSAAEVRVRLLEQAIADGDQKAIDQRMAGLQLGIRKSLADTPAAPFLWLVLFWLENSQNGFAPDHLKYLQMSYLTGPNEGWVGIKRNRLALAIFPQLGPNLSECAIHEFAQLVDSFFIGEAADILIGPGWPIREKLLPGLKDVTLINRQLFAKTVYRLGYDVSVPDVARPDFRPWD